jgi:hypothetical protein
MANLLQSFKFGDIQAIDARGTHLRTGAEGFAQRRSDNGCVLIERPADAPFYSCTRKFFSMRGRRGSSS